MSKNKYGTICDIMYHTISGGGGEPLHPLPNLNYVFGRWWMVQRVRQEEDEGVGVDGGGWWWSCCAVVVCDCCCAVAVLLLLLLLYLLCCCCGVLCDVAVVLLCLVGEEEWGEGVCMWLGWVVLLAAAAVLCCSGEGGWMLFGWVDVIWVGGGLWWEEGGVAWSLKWPANSVFFIFIIK